MNTGKKIRFFLFLLIIFLFFVWAYSLIRSHVAPTNKGAQTVLRSSVTDIKGGLPACMYDTLMYEDGVTKGTSMYKKLSEIGEIAFGVGTENSKMAMERAGMAISFTLDQRKGNWSFLTTDNHQNTCLVATGVRWHRVAFKEGIGETGKLIPILKNSGGPKQVGYSAPFEQIKEDLLVEGKILIGYGERDIDLTGSSALKVTTYFFTSESGFFTSVTSIVRKTSDGGSSEFSSIDSTGFGWKWSEDYLKYASK